MKTAVIGAGSWGTTIADLIARNGFPVKLWVRRAEQLVAIKAAGENERYLPGKTLAQSIEYSADIVAVAAAADVVFIAVPSHTLREVLRQLETAIKPAVILVSAIKGIDTDSLQRMSEVIAGVFPHNPLAVLSGPNIAKEIAAGLPAAAVVAAKNLAVSEQVQQLLVSDNFRVYTATDVIGVELGGALKNVMAIGAGIVNELALGDNLRATFMTRGLAEMIRMGVALGAEQQTFAGLSGLGDLIVTCTSVNSRNFNAGRMLAQGKSVEEINKKLQMVAEGLKTTLAAKRLADKYGVEMPIVEAAYQVIYKQAVTLTTLQQLMARDKKSETE
ncbi:MAG: NAD(P)H-dependent glycerol-3-phosphate dehydrogenase [Negativicutes bacterium]|jgi:glycerol-3-phosphate dehydrogenase (NAD(P)+)